VIPLGVSVQDLRMVVADRIPGAVAICAGALGVEPIDLIGMAERGELNTEHLMPVMTEGLRAELLSED
jgi:hypothetical protein